MRRPNTHRIETDLTRRALMRLLFAVAALPLAVGLVGEEYADPVALDAAYDASMLICAGMLAVGGWISWLLIRNPRPDETQTLSAT